MKVAIVGATGSLGGALAEVEASKGNSLYLVASDERDLKRLQTDLSVRFNVTIETQALNFGTLSEALQVKSDADRYYFPIGYSTEADVPGMDPREGARIVNVNAVGIAALTTSLIRIKTGSFDVVGFGSIAETRGRGRNHFYSMSKRALTSFFESLLHFESQMQDEDILGVHPYLFQIGYMQSQLTLGKKLLFPIAEPSTIAQKVCAIVDRGSTGIRYCPWYWRWICTVLRHLPWFIYKRLNF